MRTKNATDAEHGRTNAPNRRKNGGMAVLALFAVLAVGLLGLTALGAPISTPAGLVPHGAPNAGLRADTILNTQIYLNRSQATGTYVPEYVTLNNSSTLTKLPVLLTVTAATCKWVTVANLSTTVTAPFTYVNYVNATKTLNGTASGATADAIKGAGGLHAFLACGASAYWVNYQTFNYVQYAFVNPGLGYASAATFVNYTSPGNGVTVVNSSLKIAAAGTLVFKVWTNVSFYLTFPANVTGAQSCTGPSTGQTCTTPTWAFASASTALPTANSTTHRTFHFLAVGSTGYRNWTVVWAETNSSAANGFGQFLNSLSGLWGWVVSNAVLVALVLIVLIVAVALVGREERWGSRRRKE